MQILLLSYHFYNQTAEGLVTTKLAVALAAAGHSVTVVTSERNDLEGEKVVPQTGSLAGMTIYRVGHDHKLLPAWWLKLDGLASKSKVLDKVGAVSRVWHGCTAHEWSWVLGAARMAEQVWRGLGSTAVLHTRLNPELSHYAGIEFKKSCPDVAWCAYFSDPWPHHLYPSPYDFNVGPISQRTLERRLQGMLTQAGSLIFPSKRLQDYLLMRTQPVAMNKSHVAPHLTNSSGTVTPLPKHEQLVIRHAGFLMRQRKIEPIYEALRVLFQQQPEVRDKLRVEFAGRYEGGQLPAVPDDLQGVIHFDPLMSASSIWDWLQDAHVLLLVEAKMKEGIFFASKLADYLGADRPILALSPALGVAGDLLATGGGIVTEPDDVEGIRAAIVTLFDAWQAEQLETYLPSITQKEFVTPKTVIPIYERAFYQAVEAVQAS